MAASDFRISGGYPAQADIRARLRGMSIEYFSTLVFLKLLSILTHNTRRLAIAAQKSQFFSNVQCPASNFFLKILTIAPDCEKIGRRNVCARIYVFCWLLLFQKNCHFLVIFGPKKFIIFCHFHFFGSVQSDHLH